MFIVDYVSSAVAKNDPPVEYGIWEDQLAGMMAKIAIFDDTAIPPPSCQSERRRRRKAGTKKNKGNSGFI